MRRGAYYNEIDPYAAEWLRNLIAAGHIAAGDVDERSIVDVHPDDLRDYRQCHFFAGIGGWSIALRLAGWPDDRPVWTGSCPCQSFSVAGRQRGFDDERHLWPAWFRLIRECRPPVVFGEQVAAAVKHGWLDLVQADLEDAGYAVGAFDLCAAGVGAPHIRQRLYFVAHADGMRCEPRAGGAAAAAQRDAEPRGELVHAACGRCGEGGGSHGCAERTGHGPADDGELVHAERARLEGHAGHGDDAVGRPLADRSVAASGGARPAAGHFWSGAQWIECIDGKARLAQPGIFPLVDGVSDGRVDVGRAVEQAAATLSPEEASHRVSRAGVLRGAGNAIVPQVAAEFVMAFAGATNGWPR